jgi:hypothetical protein
VVLVVVMVIVVERRLKEKTTMEGLRIMGVKWRGWRNWVILMVEGKRAF